MWSDGMAELCLGLHHTTDDTMENTLFVDFFAVSEDHYSLVAIHQLHHTLHPFFHEPVNTTIPHCAASLQVGVIWPWRGTGVSLVLCVHCEGEPED